MARKSYGELGGELLEKQRPSRKRPIPGDIFVYKVVGRGYCFGRVISINSRQYLGNSPVFFLYLYDAFSADKLQIPKFSKEQLLIPPFYGSIQDWTSGYAETVGHAELGSDDVFKVHYMLHPAGKFYVDGFGNKIDPPIEGDSTPIGNDGFGSLATLDLWIRRALDIQMPSWTD